MTAGALHAFTLLLRVLAGPGDRVLTEHPTYAAALDAVRAAGARPVPVPMLAGGWDLDMLEATLRQAAPRLAYVIPDHQNPTGLTMTEDERVRLLALTRASRTPLVVDETIAGLELEGQPPALPIAALDPDGETAITIGSMSKAYWAGMRIGWIRANPALVRRLSAARAALDICSPVLEQLVAVELLARADEVLERQRAAARARRDAFVAALRAQLPEWRVTVPAGGLSLWVELDAPAQHRPGRDRRPLRPAPRRRPALRRRRRLRALRPPALQPARAGAGGRRRPPRGRLARGQRLHADRRSIRPRRSSPDTLRELVAAPAAFQSVTMDFHALFDAHYVPVHRYLAHRLGDPACRGGPRGGDVPARVRVTGELRRREPAGVGVHDRHQPAARPRARRRPPRRRLRRVGGPRGAPLDEPEFELPDPELARALAALRSEEREVLALYAWAELSYEEIATVTGVAVGTVRSRLARARARLAAELAPERSAK